MHRAEDWFKFLKDRKLKSFVDALQYDFLYDWIPSILIQMFVRKGNLIDLLIENE
jgi:hypothetical protein